MTNRIWIELDRKAWKTREEADAAIALANTMLERLRGNDEPNASQATFFLRNDDPHFRICFGGAMGYQELSDDGEWFNLDFLGRAMEVENA